MRLWPLATDLWLFALQNGITTNFWSSFCLSYNRLPDRLDAQVAADTILLFVSSIPFWIRELASVDQNQLSVRYGLGEILPPSVWILDATTVGREAPLNTCSDNHYVRPFLVRIASWAGCWLGMGALRGLGSH